MSVQAQSQPEVDEYSHGVGTLKAVTQSIATWKRSQDEPMAEIESGKTYSGIKFKGLNSWVTEVLQSVLNSK